ncbi:uncharacterized protein K02A2.6-like [Teleopsis dalmanni]|uniref:uncharacterized protein K02A2.6-like n=1 Tax=Teleopsis dalmanni TaxID=139649 RepID=UPI0018CF2036|nr:uncharacterized protein K02A2.6-like [Teleopsis dalmanni]
MNLEGKIDLENRPEAVNKESDSMANAAVALIGSIENYVMGEDFSLYINRIGHLLNLNKIEKDESKTSFLISLGGADLYKTLTSVLAPKSEIDFKYEEIVAKLKAHFAPTKNIIFECYQFFKRDQHTGETIADYIVELKQLARECDFGEFLDKALLIKFVCGLNNCSIQNRLLNEVNLKSFERACELALSSDMTNNSIEQMRSNSVKQISDNQRGRVNQREQLDKAFRDKSKRRYKSVEKNKYICYHCKKPGHIQKNCWYKNNENKNVKREYQNRATKWDQKNQRNVNYLVEENTVNYLCNVRNEKSEPLEWSIEIEQNKLNVEIDSGANIKVLTGQNIAVVGQVEVRVKFGGKCYELNMVVVDSAHAFKILLGRNWLDRLVPNWRKNFIESTLVNLVKENCEVDFTKYKQLFSKDNNSTIIGYEAEIDLNDNAYPIFSKAHSVPFGVRQKVEEEIQRLCAEGVMVPTTRSKWASPIVVVNKGDGSIRLCVNCRRTINRFVENEHHVIPRIDDILANLSGWKYFCKIDLTGAYLQVKVSERSQEFLTVNTHVGLYRYTRMVYGLKTAPQIFSKIISEILKGLNKVHSYFDDLLIGGANMKECEENLKATLDRLLEANVKINYEKCQFFKKELTYLGYVINQNGILPSREKVKAVLDAPAPTNKSELKSYLGMVNYYNHSIPNLSAEVSSLHELTKNNVTWIWNEKHQNIFEKSKQLIANIGVLTHYDPQKPIIISCDASPYGLGGVLSHIIDGEERSVQFVSSTLSPAEKNYSQLHREALAIVFAVKKFHNYIFGLPFTIESDHQPLREIFSIKKDLPSVAANRLQRYAVFLSMYDYSIKYKKGSQMGHADALSRLPLQEDTNEDDDSINIFNLIGDLPIKIDDIKNEMSKDVALLKTYKYVKNGWPEKIDNNLKKYFKIRISLATEDKCVFYGERIVIPESLRPKTLELLHSGHIGIVRMKAVARTYVWWPGIDAAIEEFVGSCEACCMNQKPSKQIFTNWEVTSAPFERIHADFCKFQNLNILVIVDTYSKWLEAKILRKTDAITVIEALRSTFAIFGLPKKIVTDNGPPFSSKAFIEFCINNNIECLKSPPYHPQSNGTAERGVQTVKNALRKVHTYVNEDLTYKEVSNTEVVDTAKPFANDYDTEQGVDTENERLGLRRSERRNKGRRANYN